MIDRQTDKKILVVKGPESFRWDGWCINVINKQTNKQILFNMYPTKNIRLYSIIKTGYFVTVNFLASNIM